jgi:hypothetical protein
MAHGAHFAVGQNLCNGVFGRWALLAVVGGSQVRYEIGRVVVTDVLQGSCYRFNQVFFFDQGGHVVLSRSLIDIFRIQVLRAACSILSMVVVV